jgi:hypothetical protein
MKVFVGALQTLAWDHNRPLWRNDEKIVQDMWLKVMLSQFTKSQNGVNRDDRVQNKINKISLWNFLQWNSFKMVIILPCNTSLNLFLRHFILSSTFSLLTAYTLTFYYPADSPLHKDLSLYIYLPTSVLVWHQWDVTDINLNVIYNIFRALCVIFIIISYNKQNINL